MASIKKQVEKVASILDILKPTQKAVPARETPAQTPRKAKKVSSKDKKGAETPKSNRGRPKATDPIVPFPAAMRKSELEFLAQQADKMGLNKHAVGNYLLRHGLQQLKEGKLKIPAQNKTIKVIGD